MNKTLIIFIVLSIANKHLCAMEIGSTEKERLTDKQIIQAYGYLNDEELHHTLFDIDPTHNSIVYDGLARLIALRLADQHQLRHFAGTAGLNPRFTEHQKLVCALATITHDRMLKFKQQHTKYGETPSHRIYCCPASYYRFSHDGQHLAFLARNGKTITLWRLADGTQTHRLNGKTRLEDFGFSADGRYLITKKNQTTIELIPLTPTEKAITICGGNGVQFSTNGKFEQYTLAQNMLILKALHVARSGWHLF